MCHVALMGLFMPNKNVWLKYVKLHILKKSNTSSEYYYESKLLTRAPFLLDRLAVTELEIEKKRKIVEKSIYHFEEFKKSHHIEVLQWKKKSTHTHNLLLRRHF